MTDPETTAGQATKTTAGDYARSALVIALFVLWPLLHFADYNREQLDAAGLYFMLSVFALATAVAWLAFLVFDLVSRRTRCVAATAATIVLIMCFFHYHVIFPAIVQLFQLVGLARGENYFYLLSVLLAAGVALWLLRDRRIGFLLLVFGLLANVVPAVSMVTFLASGSDAVEKEVTSPLSQYQFGPMRPNIYHIVTDGYARADSLQRLLGYDNEKFIEALRDRGFFVANKSYSNYPMTFISVPSTLAAQYLVTDKTVPFKTREHLTAMIQGANPVVTALRAQGYSYAHLGAIMWGGSKCGGREDLCLSTSKALQEALVKLTPLRRFFIDDQGSALADITVSLDRLYSIKPPTYLFAHIYSPHPPPRFADGCPGAGQEIAGKRTKVVDPGPPLANVHKAWRNKKAYLTDLECVNRQFLELADKILEKDKDAVIIFHGDHGTAFRVDWSLPLDAWPRSQLDERFAVLMALKLPERCAGLPYPSMSPINIYPMLFACLAGVAPDLKPDISYTSGYEKDESFGRGYPYVLNEP